MFISSQLTHHSRLARSTCVTLSTLSAIIRVSRVSVFAPSWGYRIRPAFYYTHCGTNPTTHWQVAASFAYRKKSSLWEIPECPEPHFPVSIGGCLPLPWRPGPVHVLCLQNSLDPCNPVQTANFAWICDTGLTSTYTVVTVFTVSSCDNTALMTVFKICDSTLKPKPSQVSTFCYETPPSETAIKADLIKTYLHLCT